MDKKQTKILLIGSGVLLAGAVIAGAFYISREGGLVDKIFKEDNPNQDLTQVEAALAGKTIVTGGSDLIPNFCRIAPQQTAQTTNFKLSEFTCKDGTEAPINVRGNIQELMNNLEVLRVEFPGKRIFVVSGYRTPDHNEAEGGEDGSYHLCAMAADITVEDIAPSRVQARIRELMRTGKMHKGGLGSYKTFTHYDIGPFREWAG